MPFHQPAQRFTVADPAPVEVVTESGGHAVDQPVLGEKSLDQLARVQDPADIGGREFDPGAMARHGDELLDRDVAVTERHHLDVLGELRHV